MKKSSKKTKKTKLKKLDKQDKILLGTLGLLIILVIILTITALNLKDKASTKKVNITIPILEEQTKNEISVDLSEMTAGETKEYVFKISNYKDKDINKNNINYDILITPSKNATIQLYKNGSTKNLVAKNNYEIEDNKLQKNKKLEDEYHMIIKTTKTPERKDRIVLKINS